jgi:hypothetical protein
MNSYLITYDLLSPGQDYTDLFEAIKKLGSWSHCLESIWIVKSNISSSEIRDKLNNNIDSNDKLLVVKLNGEAAWINLGKQCNEWLKNNL